MGIAERPVTLHLVELLVRKFGAIDGIGQPAIICEQYEALGVLIEPPDRE